MSVKFGLKWGRGLKGYCLIFMPSESMRTLCSLILNRGICLRAFTMEPKRSWPLSAVRRMCRLSISWPLSGRIREIEVFPFRLWPLSLFGYSSLFLGALVVEVVDVFIVESGLGAAGVASVVVAEAGPAGAVDLVEEDHQAHGKTQFHSLLVEILSL